MGRELNWLKYEKVRREGRYNMITDIVSASKEAGLSLEEYKDVIRNYDEYKSLVEQMDLDTESEESEKNERMKYLMEKELVCPLDKEELRELEQLRKEIR